MRVPAGSNQNSLVPQIQTLKISLINRATGPSSRVYHQTFDIGQAFKRQSAEINPFLEPMERRVNVGSSVGDHLDPPDLKRRALGVSAAGRVAAQVIGDDRSGKPGIGDHSRFDFVAYIDQSSRHS